MIPIRDSNPSGRNPIVNKTIIGLNIAVFIFQYLAVVSEGKFIYIYGLVPARYSLSHIAEYFSMTNQIVSFLSFMFLHGGFWHLAGNMWSLYIFGDNIEDRLGHVRYLIFYILSGIFSGLVHMAFNFHSNIPVIGASGAIAGVMGAYLILYPRAKLLMFLFFIPFELPAFIFLGLWFVFQFFNAASGATAGIAWWAHIGGFIAGIILLKIFNVKTDKKNRLSRDFFKAAKKVKTQRIQIIRPKGDPDDFNLYAILEITQFESMTGITKRVKLAWGFYSKFYKINVPSGIKDNQIIRLQGLGKANDAGGKGDLLLKVRIKA
jgi:membrane associated rhomboid family serine protease